MQVPQQTPQQIASAGPNHITTIAANQPSSITQQQQQFLRQSLVGGGANCGVYRTPQNPLIGGSGPVTDTMDYHHHQIRHIPGGVNIVFDESNVSILYNLLKKRKKES